MTMYEELNRIGTKMLSRRVHAAESVAWQALTIRPLDGETAEQVLARIRFSVERNHPELLVRFEHSRQEILPLADSCGCDPEGEGYDDDHCESDEGGQDLCARKHLGFVCGDCVNENGDGPSWRPDRYEWPCPKVAELDQVEPAR